MSDHIPFITSQAAFELVKSVYSDSEMARVSLDSAGRFTPLPGATKLWIDPAVDGLHDLTSRRSRPERKNAWFEYMKGFTGFEKIAEPASIAKRDLGDVKQFTKELLDKCVAFNPYWISVPQLPIVASSARNKINRLLAASAGEWKSSHAFKGRMILPLIFTNQKQINGKTERNPKVDQARRCYEEAHADGFWVVDATLIDDNGSSTLSNKRFPGIIALHEELNQRISSKIRIAGPYWGLNLVLWARGLIDYPVIGLGANYQYHIAGGGSNPPNTRLAIPPLRRRVVGAAQLGGWLERALKILGPMNPAGSELERIQRRLTLLSARAPAQVARFYKDWFDLVAASPKAGRSLALFQDLSAAYALGKSLPAFAWEGTARRPEAVVESLMLSCL